MGRLSRRALNRALLHRQFLVERTGRTPLEVIGHLVAMQAQEPNWPYVGLWSRIDGFAQAHLGVLLEKRLVVWSDWRCCAAPSTSPWPTTSGGYGRRSNRFSTVRPARRTSPR
ncbi:winged helix DNA-binding domain-containing protein [Planotetraspora sp. A-T 1434]|nr:winged helix DNA-binding domain-containing protein [Planotetraspora sp. A-T 1434]MCT9932016.1 winged helix DNA-binding domain-containing protein [Planotetraspora sp. A-T 1434]